MEFLIAVLALVVAGISLSKHTDAKLELKRLRRDFENYKRRADAQTAAPENSAQPANEVGITPEKRDALSASESIKSAPKPTQKPDWAKPSPKMAAPKPKPPKPPRKSFEEALGAQWSVWVGGLALLLGAVFLLRYSIEAGVFSPAMRVAMASALGVTLLGASEWMLRVDSGHQSGHIIPAQLAAKLGFKPKNKTQPPNDALKTTAKPDLTNIPGILAAVGIFALLGAVYAAYALYGFLSPFPAFSLLGLISLGAIALSLRHGPVLAALGLAASLATPLLVETESPNIYLLYGYLLIVASAAIAVARRREWGWLTLLTLASLLGWSMLSINGALAGDKTPAWYGFLALGFAAAVLLAKPADPHALTSKDKNPDKTLSKDMSELKHSPLSAVIWGGIAAVLMCGMIIQSVSGYPRILLRVDYILPLAGSAFFFAAAFLKPLQRAHVFSGALIGAFTVWSALNANYGLSEILITTAGLSVATLLLTTRGTLAPRTKDAKISAPPNLIWPLFAVVYPVIIFGAMGFDSKGPSDNLLAGIFIAFALVNAGLAWLMRGKPALAKHASVFVIGAAMLYVLAVFLAFDGLMLTLALLAGLVIAALAGRTYSYATVRMIAPAFAGLSALHTLLIALHQSGAVSSSPIVNELWLYLALPALLCAGAAWFLQKPKSDVWSEGLKAFALAFAALFIVFQIRHIMNGGQLFAPRLSFEELSLQVLTGLCFTLGGARIGRQTLEPKAGLDRNLLPALMMGLSLLSLAAFALGVCFGKAPLFNSFEPVRGNLAVNSLLLGYLISAVILCAIAWLGRETRPKWYVRIAGGLAGFSIVLYVTSMIRFGFQGADISLITSLPKGVELYAISAAWLSLGIIALIIGLKTKRQDIRLASAVLMTLTVLKAFLIDMASLEGVLRAMSFVVLGLVLIVIGRVYQNVLSRDGVTAESA